MAIRTITERKSVPKAVRNPAKKDRVLLTIRETIDLLVKPDQAISAAAIYSLSDLTDDHYTQWEVGWPTIPRERRIQLIQQLGETSETNFEMDFTRAVRLALADSDAEVRAAAIEAAWYDETPELLRRLITLTERDPSDEVRASAMSSIGRFILLGELGKLNQSAANRAQAAAFAAYQNDDSSAVHRRAVEALGNSSRDEVTDLIQEAYDSDNAQMRASAVFAMGRSCDDSWGEIVLDELSSPDSEMRYEAARAAGELELRRAIPVIGTLLDDEDREVLEMAVWALGEIGGGEARHLLENALERADQAEDDFLSEAIDEALASTSLVGESLFNDENDF